MQTNLNLSEGDIKKVDLLVRFHGAKNRTQYFKAFIDKDYREAFGDADPDSVELVAGIIPAAPEGEGE
jgi:hypothetical protein